MFELAERLGWRSYDPFDVLLSPYLRRLPRVSPLAARVAVQVGRRSGARLRRALRVTVHEEPKTLSEFLRAAVLLSPADEGIAASIPGLASRLRAHARPEGESLAWGITFPYVSRFGYFAPETPTIYDSILAVQALLDASEATGDDDALAAAKAGCRFLVGELGPFEHDGMQWLPYFPGSRSRILNVQASAAAVLARASALDHDLSLAEFADRAAETVVATQRVDGSWPYSDDGRANFVDGFHTGFTLEGLHEYVHLRRTASVVGVEDAIARGFTYFKSALVTDEGLPRGFAGGRVSLDGQNVAQCVQTLLALGDTSDHLAAMRLWEQIFVGDRRSRGFTALRWTIAPAVFSGARLVAWGRASGER
jgi:polysaccharide biosynthesis protein VpsJ